MRRFFLFGNIYEFMVINITTCPSGESVLTYLMSIINQEEVEL